MATFLPPVPDTRLESLATLKSLGLNDASANKIYRDWKSIHTGGIDHQFPWDFGEVAQKWVEAQEETFLLINGMRRYDHGDPVAALRRMGANNQFVNDFVSPLFDDNVRSWHPPAVWFDKVLGWRWEWAQYKHDRANYTAAPTSQLPVAGSQPPEALADSEECITLWRCSTLVKASRMWSARRGRSEDKDQWLSNQFELSGFHGTASVLSWSPDLESVHAYARFASRLAHPAELCLVRMDVPKSLLTSSKTLTLRFPEKGGRKWSLLRIIKIISGEMTLKTK